MVTAVEPQPTTTTHSQVGLGKETRSLVLEGWGKLVFEVSGEVKVRYQHEEYLTRRSREIEMRPVCHPHNLVCWLKRALFIFDARYFRLISSRHNRTIDHHRAVNDGGDLRVIVSTFL